MPNVIRHPNEFPKEEHFQVIVFGIARVAGFDTAITNIYCFIKNDEMINFLKKLENECPKKKYFVQKVIPAKVNLQITVT